MPPVIIAAVATIGMEAIAVGSLTAALTSGMVWAQIAFSAAVSLVGETLSRPKSQQSPMTAEVQNRKQLVRASADPRRVVYGQVQVSGTLLYASNGTDTNYVHLVIALAGHSSHAIGDCWLGDELLGTLDAGGLCTTGRFAGHVRVKKYLGTAGQAMDADLATECPEWGAKNRPLKGITYVYLRIKRNREVFPMGLPTPRFMLSGKNDILDPRSGLTGYTTNAALCTLDYILWKHGIGSTLDEVVQSTWIAAANGCDEDVAVPGGGTQKRYTVNGSFTLDRNPVDVLDEMRSSAMAGCASYSMGVWEGHAGVASAPVMDLSEADLRGPYKVRMRPSRAQLYNAVKGTYISAADRWVETDFPPAINAAYEAQDGGERIYKDVKLPFTIDPYAAQRMAKIDLERHRQGIVVDYPARIVGLKLKVWDVVRLNIAAMGWTNKQFRVVDKKISLFGGADLVLEEYSSAIYSWTSLEATLVDPAPDTTLPNPFTVAVPASITLTSGTSELLSQSDGTIVSRIKATWPAPGDASATRAEIQIKPSSADESAWQTLARPNAGDEVAWLDPVQDGIAYDVRLRFENGIGVRGAWTNATPHIVMGKTLLPANVAALVATLNSDDGSIDLTWPEIADADRNDYAICEGDIWAGTITWTAGTSLRIPATKAGSHTWRIRARDTSGNLSAVEATATLVIAQADSVEGRAAAAAASTQAIVDASAAAAAAQATADALAAEVAAKAAAEKAAADALIAASGQASVTIDNLGNALISFDIYDDPQILSYELREGASFDAGTYVAQTTGNTFTLPVLGNAGKTFWIRAKYETGYSIAGYRIDFSGTNMPAPGLPTWSIAEPNLVYTWAAATGATQYLCLFEVGGVTTVKTVATPGVSFPIPKYAATIRIVAMAADGTLSPFVDEDVSIAGQYNYNEIVNVALPLTTGQYLNLAFTAANTVKRASLLGNAPVAPYAQNINDGDLYAFGYNLANLAASSIQNIYASWFRHGFWRERSGYFESAVVDLGAVLTGSLLLNLTKTVTYVGNAPVSGWAHVAAEYLADAGIQTLTDQKAFLTARFFVATDSPFSATWKEAANGDWITARYVKIVVEVAMASPLTEITVTAGAITIDVPDITETGSKTGVTSAGTAVTFTKSFHAVSVVIATARGAAKAYTGNITATGCTLYVDTGTQQVDYFVKGY